jgi:hypothetical protein
MLAMEVGVRGEWSRVKDEANRPRDEAGSKSDGYGRKKKRMRDETAKRGKNFSVENRTALGAEIPPRLTSPRLGLGAAKVKLPTQVGKSEKKNNTVLDTHTSRHR